MKRKLLLPLVLMISGWFVANAQVTPACPTPPPPGAESCQTTCVYCDFDGYMGINNGTPSGGNTVCGVIAIHNDQWFGFVAGTETITIDVLTSNCQDGNGLQSAFFEACGDDAIVCNPGTQGGAGMPLTLSYSGFVPGQTYYLMIDGWTGDVCDYEIDVTEGSITPPPPGPANTPQGPTTVCPGATVTFTVPETANAGFYNWSAPAGSLINGNPTPENFEAPDGTSVDITFGNVGGQVCVTVGNACFPPTTKCITVTNQPIPPTIKPDIIVCFEDLPFIWDEAPNTTINNPGTVTLTSSAYDSYLGCDSTVKQKVIIKNQIKTNLGFKYLCSDECLNVGTNSYCDPGQFTEVLESFQGCDSLVDFTIIKLPADAIIQAPTPINCNNPVLSLNSAGSSPSPGGNTTYTWFNTNWFAIGNQTTQNVSTSGTYSLVISTNGGGKSCKDTATVTITANTTPPGVTATGGTIGCQSSNQSITLQASSGTSGVNFQWSGPGITPANQNQQNPTVTLSGSYTVTVTNPVNGCSSTANVTVNADNTPPNASATASTLTCGQPIININGSTNMPSASFNWSGPGINAGNQTLEDPPVTVPGVYNVTVTNTVNSCTSTATVTVNQDIATPTASAGTDPTITCTQSSVLLNGAGTPANVNFNWSGPGITPANQTLANPSVNIAGNYILTVTNPTNGCIKTDTVTVNASINPPVADAGTDPTLTCAVTSVTIGGNTSSQGANFQATWSGPGINPGNANQYTPTVGISGNYQITVLNTQNGCTSTDNVTVNINTNAPTANAGTDQTLTCSSPNGVSLSGSGSPAGITYLWSGPGIGANNETQQNPTVTVAGPYVLEVTNPVNGCTATDQVNVDQDASVPVANAGPDLVLNCTVSSVDIDGSASSTGGSFNYQWSGPGISGGNSTIQSPTGITLPGTYNLTVTNTFNNCINTDILVVSIDTIHPAASAGASLILNCYNNGSDTLDASASDLGAGFSLTWSGPGINAGNNTLVNPIVSVPGVYLLTITNTDNTCTSTAQTNVASDLLPPTADAGADEIIDCVTTSTVIGGNSSSGANFTFLWTGPAITPANATNATATVDIQGTYNLLVTNVTNGCTSTDAMDVTLNAVYPAASAGIDRLLTCAQTIVTLDGSASSNGANFQIVWTGPGINGSNSNQVSPQVTQPGMYIVSVTDNGNSCSSIDTVQVAQNIAQPAASAGADLHLDCQTTDVTLDGSLSANGATITYLWSGAGITPGTESQQSPVITQPDTYTLLVTDTDNGCSSTDQVTVTQDVALPTASAGNTFTLTCAQNTQAIDGSGSSVGPNFTYTWQGPGINTGNFNVQNPIVADSGLYIVTVTNTTNFCTATDQVYVALDGDFPLTEAGPNQELTCGITTVQLDGSQSLSGPGINYLWSGPGILPGQQTSPTPTVNAPGLYTLTVSNTNNGCTKTDVVTVNQNLTPPIADAGQDQILTCASTNGVTISASASSTGPGFTLLWSGPGIDMTNETQVSPTVTVPGTYSVVITSNANGCTASDDVIVDQDQDLPTANAGLDQIITCNDPQAILDGTGSTTGGTIQFLWSGPGINSNNQGDISPNVSAGGTYTLVVTNTQTNCQAMDNVVVTLDNQPPSVTLTTDTITCTDPQGTLTVTSSAPNSAYHWQGVDINPGNQDDAVVTVDQPGLYTVTVTPPNGCTVVESIVMEVDANFPQGTAEGTELNCGNDGTSTIGGSVSTPNATFEWTGPGNFFSTDPNPTVTAPGNYTFTVIAPNGCEHDINVVVTADFAAPIANATVPEFIDCNTPEVSILGSGSSIGPVFTYQWTTTDGNILGGANGLEPLVDAPGAYTLLVTNLDNGCTSTTTVSVQNDPEVPTGFDLAIKDIRCFGESSGVIEVNSVVGGTAPFAFTLTNANGDVLPGYTNLNAGEYTISLLDANGCAIDTTVSISSPEQLLVSLGDDISIQLGEDVTVAAEIVNDANVPVASWSWNPLAHCDTTCLEYTWQPTATYRQRITVIDENGCEASDEVLVIVRKDRLVYVPSVFDPESDDPANALLSIYTGLGVTKVRQWLIFDRWGDAVFQVDQYQPVPSNVPDPAFAWDGKVRGEKVTPGVYVWYAEIEFADGVVEIFKGDVTLLRNK